MNLLDKIQNKLKGESEPKSSGSPSDTVNFLNKLPDDEKLKVLDYLGSIKELGTNNLQANE